MTYTNTLRPGLLVSMSTSCRGNVQYQKLDLDEQHDAATEVTKWETTRTIADKDEHERAKKAQSQARGIVTQACYWTAFGLLCPEARADQLDGAIARAQAVVDEFNATAQLTRLRLHIMVGKIASDDVEAVQRINREVRELMDDMASGMQKLDVKSIRDAADKARELGNMLNPDAQVRVQLAIDAARGFAKQIVKAGEAAAIEVDAYSLEQLRRQRTAFLDLGDEVEIARPQAAARAIDLTPENNDAV